MLDCKEAESCLMHQHHKCYRYLHVFVHLSHCDTIREDESPLCFLPPCLGVTGAHERLV